jgi:hypothetical protein
MVIGAWAMTPADFTQFALFTLMGSLVQGVSFSGLVQPALINQRNEDNSFVPLRYVAIPAAAGSILFLIFALVLGIRSLHDLLLLSGSAAVPIYYNWIRYRAIGFNRRWVVAQADFLRLGLTLAAVAAPSLAADSVALQTYFAAATALPFLLVAIRLPRIVDWVPYRHYRRAAAWQLIDWMFGSMLVSLPLLLLGSVSPSPLIGGVRLAQSLLGPLNLAFAAAITNLIADGVTRSELTATGSLISRGISLSRLLTGLSLLLVVTMVTLVYVTSISLKGVALPDLIVGLALVGASSVTSAGSGVHAMVLRLLGWQATVTLGRGIIATLTFGAFALAYFWHGVDVSLVAGFITLALAAPIVLIGLAHYAYQRFPLAADPRQPSYQRLER